MEKHIVYPNLYMWICCRFAYIDFKDKQGLSSAIEFNGSSLEGWSLMVEEAGGAPTPGSGGGGRGFGGRGGGGFRGGRGGGRGDFGDGGGIRFLFYSTKEKHCCLYE